MKKFLFCFFVAMFAASSLLLSCSDESESLMIIPAPQDNGNTGTVFDTGYIVKADTNFIVETINNMTKSGTIKAKGVFNSKLIKDVKSALNNLEDERPNVLVALDLSAVEGLVLADSSFSYCKNLAGIILPNDKTNMTSIGSYAFKDCRSLASVTIPSSVTSIGGSAFSGCTSLCVNYTGTLAQWCNINFSSEIPNVKFCVQGQEIKDLIIPTGLEKINSCLFTGWAGLTSVTIPNSVTSIGGSAFRGCTSLASVTIPSSVTSIGDEAFYGCKNLSVNYAGTLAQWCNIDFSSTIPNEKFCVQGQEIKYLVIPAGLEKINSKTFAGCTGLTSVTIPSSVTSIGDGAFGGCTSLASVTIPNSVTSIGSSAFYGCTSLASVTIPNSVTSIGDGTFYACSKLASVTIPGSVTSIGYRAFNGCTKLANVTIPTSVTKIYWLAFYGCTSLADATFSDANGWYYTENSNFTGGSAIDPDRLANTATAAQYLKSTYCNYDWYKNN